MIKKILIANRGEIACRVIKTAKKMGIRTVAVYSKADNKAEHVRFADEAFAIGPAPSKDSYLCGDKILEAAKKAGADAIHSGYGFLSENVAFAEACIAANIIFIGPPADAIRAMASKSAAKKIMGEAAVPMLPGYHEEIQDPEFLRQQAEKIGFPILLKAVLGGGGKGMRVVNTSAEFMDALQSAKREALAGFKDERMLIEKYLTKPRHIEIQVFADNHGQTVYLFERDCSIQRRHQKIIEEAPAPNLAAQTRQAMGEAAVTAAQRIGYVGAGTVEFLLDPPTQQFYFMEMNTRLQVEHPVTEFITQLDLVEWQIRVAQGEPLPLNQTQIQAHGHAIEVRVYAEDPNQNFLPAIGELHRYRPPTSSEYVRIDSGVAEGSRISPYYDPMIAKLIVWGENRAQAVLRMQQALSEYVILGVKNNLGFLQTIISHPAFANAALSTNFLAEHVANWQQAVSQLPIPVLLLTVLFYQLPTKTLSFAANVNTDDTHSPWLFHDGWQMNTTNSHTFVLQFNKERISVQVASKHGEFHLTIPKNCGVIAYKTAKNDSLDLAPTDKTNVDSNYIFKVQGEFCTTSSTITAQINEQAYRAVLYPHARGLMMYFQHHVYELQPFEPLLFYEHTENTEGQLIAPMPGTVIALHTKSGTQVQQGTPLIVIEAMKMEHTLYAPHDGLVQEIKYQIGDLVNEGDELLVLKI